MIRNLLALTGFLAIALVSAMGLQAYGYFDDRADPPRARVSYAGLDLATPEGLRILEQRVNAAIDDVCRGHEGRELWRRRDLRECREEAIAGVTPQVDYAVDRARRARTRVIAEEDLGPPPAGRYAPSPPPPPPPVYAPAAEQPPLKLVRRTVVTTRTVTTTRPGPPPAEARPAWRPRPVVQPLSPRTTVYHRLPEQPGSWLPPAAWRSINGAIVRAFRTGRTTPWLVADREGYVTVSDKRWVNGCVCRNVRSVKYADGRQIVVAEGMKCLPRGR